MSFDTPPCQTSCDSASKYKTPYSQDKNFFQSGYGLSGESDMQQDIMKYGSIEVAFTVYADFEAYKSGIYQYKTGEELGGHAVKIIGWGVQNGVKYWTVANSWNVDWGEKGFFRIIRGVNDCGIEGEGSAGVPKLQ